MQMSRRGWSERDVGSRCCWLGFGSGWLLDSRRCRCCRSVCEDSLLHSEILLRLQLCLFQRGLDCRLMQRHEGALELAVLAHFALASCGADIDGAGGSQSLATACSEVRSGGPSAPGWQRGETHGDVRGTRREQRGALGFHSCRARGCCRGDSRAECRWLHEYDRLREWERRHAGREGGTLRQLLPLPQFAELHAKLAQA